ncbi:hypothetical protein M9H77_02735 [Catharanthus roseus]|uniref:Uncharacterized protein n=1 Tax=Catharanthus roseus TaxID=4058 RepID=A0ACC0C9I2_CATRO|nr:hypothetical protein M9H77_02735 [Catharanthus roseus]
MSDMSFEKEENNEIERKDRVEEKERLVENSSSFDSISSLGEECEKDESSKEEENDLEKNERAKESEKLEEETYFLDSIATMFEVCENVENLERKIETVELGNTSEELKDKECECWHDILDIDSMASDSFPWVPRWGMIPNFLDSFVGNFLVKKVEGYLCSLIEDLLDKSIRRERCSYMILFFETFIIALNGIAPFKNHFLNVKVQLENPCDHHKFLIGLEVLKSILIEKILGFQFYHLHFKESMVLLICENKKDGFGVLNCHGVFVNTILRKDFVELLLKNFVEKHLCYFKTFIEILWKDVFLDGLHLKIMECKGMFESELVWCIKSSKELSTFGLHSSFGTLSQMSHNLSYTYPNEMIQASMEGTSYNFHENIKN